MEKELFYSETLSKIKINKLLSWRGRYSKQEYPFKVAFNLLYELLTIEKMWGEIQSSYKKSFFNFSNNKFNRFEEAHKFIIDRSNTIAQTEIHSIVMEKFNAVNAIAGIKWDSLRSRVAKAQNGDNKEIQEIELAYYFYTCGIELIYAWSALGFLGKDQESAFMQLSGMIMGGVDYSSLQSLVHFFGQTSTMYYKPLPALF